MPVYTIHAPRAAGPEPLVAPDRFRFVRDGFHFWAFATSLIWLIWHRLWWATLGYIVLSVVGGIALAMLGAGSGTRLVVMFLFALLMGFEASSIRRWTLSRGKWRQLDLVVAEDEETAERRFFERWTTRREFMGDTNGVERGGPPPTRNIPGQSFSRPPAREEIIGLFPQPGASR
ncbi:MAG: DUF2628 domain-containing protein [Tardiphaga sp.]|jgi:uncharacterized protein (DUF58 family)|uniref:DUF2628 domain-containing protein n=1 Tax=Tardiphaga sp. TaxID=1926292 RepID=UPI0019C099DD|nr:DUF2628 domain-containing protein [Tardiphaga sp.]MBC7585832.1 DUF2628 domain-containing protein [Tardiphaga sp.]